MKTLGYISLFAAAAILAGCEDEARFGEQNIGKERPVVEVTVDEVTSAEAQGGIAVTGTFSVTVSDGAAEFGYAVLSGTGSEAPDAYSILVGEVDGTYGAGTFFHEDGEGARQFSFSVTAASYDELEDYTIYAAAITETGLTSDVASATVHKENIPEPVPDFTVNTGGYTVMYESDGAGLEIESPEPGTSFTMGLILYEGERSAADEDLELYALNGCWFNMAEAFGSTKGALVHPILLGTLDRESRTITFDRMIDPASVVGSDRTVWKIYADSPYETGLATGGEDDPVYMLRGSGSGNDPIVVTLDEDGTAQTISSCGFARIDPEAESPIVAFYDRMESGTMEKRQ